MFKAGDRISHVVEMLKTLIIELGGQGVSLAIAWRQWQKYRIF